MHYAFNGLTTDSDPGSGQFRYNNGTIGSVTQIFIDLVDADGITQTDFIDSWDDSTNTVKGVLLVQDRDNNTFGATFNVTSVTTATGYRKIGVTYLAGTIPTSGDSCIIIFAPAGNVGATGPSGGGLAVVDAAGKIYAYRGFR